MGIRSRLRREKKIREAFDDDEQEQEVRKFERAVALAEKTGSAKVMDEMKEQMLTGMRNNLVSQLSKGNSREEIMEAANRMLGELRSNERYMRIMQRIGITDNDLEKLFIGAMVEVFPDE